MKYDISFALSQNQCLDFTITCMNSQNSVCRLYKSKLQQEDIRESTKQLFASIIHLHRYLLVNSSNLSFDNVFLQLVIKVDILGQFKYIYLPIIVQNIQQTLSQRLREINQQYFALQGQFEIEKKHLAQVYRCNVQQEQIFQFKYRSNCHQHRRLTLELQSMQAQLIKIGRTIIMHEDGIVVNLKNNTKQLRKNLKLRLFVHSHQISKISNPKVASLLGNNVQSLIYADLNKCQLNSMKFVEILVNVKQMRLSQNKIKKIEGLLYMINLSILDLSNNNIQRIQNLQQNVNMTILILHSNRLCTIENIFHLYKLQILSLSNNMIEQIPQQIQLLFSLSQLRIINNQLERLPNQLFNLKNIQVLSILGNPCFSSLHRCSEIIDRLVTNKKIMTGCVLF